MKTRTTLLGLAAALTCAHATPAFAQAADPDVQAIIAKVAGAYRNISSFSATFEMTQGAGSTAQKITTKILLKKPNIAATITLPGATKHFVADGTNYYADSSTDMKTYTKGPAADFSAAVNALASQRGAGVGLLPILLTSNQAEQQIIPGKPSAVKKLADATEDNSSCDVVQATVGAGDNSMDYTFSFSKADHLLRKLAIARHSAPSLPIVVESYAGVTTSPTISAGAFKYVASAGAVAKEPPKQPAYFDERLVPGFTPFALKGNDLAGNPVSYDQYKGKVLLVDFWATWCGPCVAELPNVIAAYGKYHSQGFEVLGISLDQKDARPKLEAFIKEHNMPWAQVYDGGYWQAANAVAYGVRAIPFTLLIGKDGKIAAVGARGPALAPAIEAALKK
jgi:outer membrane lipoprotein-sorting protein/thiol-disulfide isomerase/thioredoxin